MTAPVPAYEVVTRPGLYVPGGAVYKVTPVKGARVSGLIVGDMRLEYERDRWGKAQKDAPFPQVAFELSPRFVEDDGKPAIRRRHALQINGKAYTDAFFATVTFLPAEPDDDRTRWYPLVTMDGRDYLLSERFTYYPGLTDAARRVLVPLLRQIAAEYATPERWHQAHITEAIRRYDDAKEVVVGKQAELDKAVEGEASAWAALQAMIGRHRTPLELA